MNTIFFRIYTQLESHTSIYCFVGKWVVSLMQKTTIPTFLFNILYTESTISFQKTHENNKLF